MNSKLFGLLAILSVGICVGLVIAHNLKIYSPSDEVWAFWGGVVGAALSVWGAIYVADRTLRNREVEVADELNRRRLGSRAMLAADLSLVTNYTRQCSKFLMQAIDFVELPRPIPEGIDLKLLAPDFDQNVLSRLQSFVEVSDNQNALKVVRLMQCYQVQRSRLLDNANEYNEAALNNFAMAMIHRQQFHGSLESTVELYGRAVQMFSFARLETEAIPEFSAANLDGHLLLLKLFDWLTHDEIAMLRNAMQRDDVEN